MSIKFVRRIHVILILFAVMFLVCACKDFKQTNVTSKENSPDWIVKLADEKKASQLLVVAGVGKTTACVSMHEIDSDGTWKEIISTPGFIGKEGLGKASEEVAITPIGTFHFNRAFGIADDPGCSIEYKKVTEDDYWSGDHREGYAYNQMVNIKDYKDLDVSNSEHLIDYNKQYQYCLNISWNEEGIPGDGSAFFLHCFGPYKPYTGGCVSIPKDKMIEVMKHVKPDCVVVIDYLKNISPETWEDWEL